MDESPGLVWPVGSSPEFQEKQSESHGYESVKLMLMKGIGAMCSQKWL